MGPRKQSMGASGVFDLHKETPFPLPPPTSPSSFTPSAFPSPLSPLPFPPPPPPPPSSSRSSTPSFSPSLLGMTVAQQQARVQDALSTLSDKDYNSLMKQFKVSVCVCVRVYACVHVHVCFPVSLAY